MTDHTICAPATGPGGAIGIIRVSGSDAIRITDSIFRPSHAGKTLAQAPTHTIHYGNIVDDEGRIVDDVLVSLFRAPHSYTGEDSTEISCHGSPYILRRVLQLLIKAGCRQAQPGEYTRRAFMNGKIDLSQAEAVADLIAAANRATHRMAVGQLRGNLSNELSQLREKLLDMTTLLELELDFSDQDVTFADRQRLLQLALHIDTRITTLLNTFQTGRAVKQGIPVAIVGKTNVGKSTLLNRLLREDKAIVSPIHGTTRDVIEDTIDIRGVTFRLIDTAGIRPTGDQIERIGIERTYRQLRQAAIVLWLIDSQPTTEELAHIARTTRGKQLIVLRNKADLDNTTADSPDTTGATVSKELPQARYLRLSALRDPDTITLEDAIFRAADIPEISENSVIITSTRHQQALLDAHESITAVISGLHRGLSADLLSEDLRLCISQLGEITGGAISTEETLQAIFKDFCVGK